MNPPGQDGLTYEEIVDALLASMTAVHALSPPVPPAPWDAFVRLSSTIHQTFTIPSTTFTAIMRRLLFGIGWAARPRRLVGLGTYVGYTFAWLLRDRSDETAAPFLERAVGIDVDPQANALARRNCEILRHGARLSFLDADASETLAAWEDAIDLLYLDLDSPDTGKAGYAEALQAALPHLASGALVLAHDPCVLRFRDDFDAYHDFVSRSGRFSHSWVLPVDVCGLSVAVAR